MIRRTVIAALVDHGPVDGLVEADDGHLRGIDDRCRGDAAELAEARDR